MARAGAKRKVGKREPNGRLQRVEANREHLQNVARRARMYAISEETALNPLSDCLYGRMFLAGLFDEQELRACQKYEWLELRIGKFVLDTPHSKAINYEMARGISLLPELTQEQIDRLRTDYHHAVTCFEHSKAGSAKDVMDCIFGIESQLRYDAVEYYKQARFFNAIREYAENM